jgi:hypothetical protein
MKVLTNQVEREEAHRCLRELLASRGEWFYAETGDARAGARQQFRAPVSLRAGEWDVRASGAALHFACWSETGWRAWRVAAWEWSGGKLSLGVTRRAGAERATLELVPRASAREGAAEVAAARRAACERLAALLCAHAHASQVLEIESARLSRGARRSEPGRYARILLRRGRGELIAATGALVPVRAHEVDAMLASALAWWLQQGKSVRVRQAAGANALWIVASRELSRPIAERLALLRDELRGAIKLFVRDETDEATAADRCETKQLREMGLPCLASLMDGARRFRHAPRVELSETASRLVALAPAEIDVVHARHGETLRFNGLPFARVRLVAGQERVWFGAAGQRRLLDEGNARELSKLLDELAEHRRADAGDTRHAYFRAAPEAWLESILRRDITRLDPGLVVAPLHAQFRASRETPGARPVDLLALRRDGRLVVIELKVAEDAALPIQGADYYRRVEAHRLSGDIRRARLFGDLDIADAPPLVYLAAPVFRFHRGFQTLARCVTPEIEMYRFDLNEDWRAGVRVIRRTKVN